MWSTRIAYGRAVDITKWTTVVQKPQAPSLPVDVSKGIHWVRQAADDCFTSEGLLPLIPSFLATNFISQLLLSEVTVSIFSGDQTVGWLVLVHPEMMMRKFSYWCFRSWYSRLCWGNQGNQLFAQTVHSDHQSSPWEFSKALKSLCSIFPAVKVFLSLSGRNKLVSNSKSFHSKKKKHGQKWYPHRS